MDDTILDKLALFSQELQRYNCGMNGEHKLRWNYSRLFENKFPIIATVFAKFGEATDAGAIIIENHLGQNKIMS
jgi:hypothetical protein